MRTVYVVNEHAKPGEPTLIRKPTEHQRAWAAWSRRLSELWSSACLTVSEDQRREREASKVPR